LISGEAIEG